ncbi:RDD family protein [Clostridium akagii]|uniref:RDD family protein n=1 Tax=Clostridium akagii TaxID=91623 RepID=UPI00068B4C70|nr:RDD family protein [Clostridium akagii]
MKENNSEIQDDKINVNERVTFLPSLISSIVDQALIAAIAGVVLFIANFIMQFAGYYIAEKLQMFIILYVICNIIYISVFEASRLSATPGKVLLKSKVVAK